MLDERPPVLTDLDDPPAIPVRSVVGRWRLSARLARREIRRRPWRTLLVVLLVAVPVAALSAADTAYRSDQLPLTERRYGQFAAHLTIGAAPSSLTAAALRRHFGLDLRVQLGFSAYAPIRRSDRPELVAYVQISTFDISTPDAAGMVWLRAGRFPATADEVLLSADVARDLRVGVGDAFTLMRPSQTFRVAGIGSVGWMSTSTLIAPGFDVGAIRPENWAADAFFGSARNRAEDGELVAARLASATTSSLGADGWSFDPGSDLAATTDPVTLFLGWLGGAMLMAVLGIVVATAFAVSGRRHLVTIGQLSAAGADRTVLRRFLALQGTLSGAAGAAVGLAGGAIFVAASGELVRNQGRIDVNLVEWGIAAVTAVVVATVASVVPARALTRASVLTALAGRRPVADVRRSHVGVGLALVAAGLVVLFLAVTDVRRSNQAVTALGTPTAVAILAGFAILGGVCCLCPPIVAAIGSLGSTAGGSIRLATRSVHRHRARSAAVIASVAAVGAAVVAMGAIGEQRQLDDARSASPFGQATITVDAFRSVDGSPVAAETVDPTIRAEIEKIVGPARWLQSSAPGSFDDRNVDPTRVFIADPDVVALFRFGRTTTERILSSDVTLVWSGDLHQAPSAEAVAAWFDSSARVDPDHVAIIGRPVGNIGELVFVSRGFAEAHHIDVVASTLYVTADHNLSDDEIATLSKVGSSDYESVVFTGTEQPEYYLRVGTPYRAHGWRALYSWGLAVGALVLVLMVVSLGMALWAAEGRDEREALVTLGAPPSTLAATTGLKAWILATAGGVIAVPLGFGTLRLCIAAARRHTQFPWLIASVVLFVVPAIVGVATWIGSRLAQRLRPLRMSTSAFE